MALFCRSHVSQHYSPMFRMFIGPLVHVFVHFPTFPEDLAYTHILPTLVFMKDKNSSWLNKVDTCSGK